jgi:Ca2+-binding EF-hand superfamily protein
MIDFEMERKQAIKLWVKEQLPEKKVIEILKANSGKISKDTFENLITTIGFVLKKSSVSELFTAFSKGDDFILI